MTTAPFPTLPLGFLIEAYGVPMEIVAVKFSDKTSAYLSVKAGPKKPTLAISIFFDSPPKGKVVLHRKKGEEIQMNRLGPQLFRCMVPKFTPSESPLIRIIPKTAKRTT